MNKKHHSLSLLLLGHGADTYLYEAPLPNVKILYQVEL